MRRDSHTGLPEPQPSGTVRQAGPDHRVLSLEGTQGKHCTRPCPECPWRRGNAGLFPALAFEHSAETAYDLSRATFACHAAGADQPKVCAGFLLRGAAHNLRVRFGLMLGEFQDVEGGAELFDSYREMAETNGVDPASPALAPCRE